MNEWSPKTWLCIIAPNGELGEHPTNRAIKSRNEVHSNAFWGSRTSPRLPCPSVSLLAQSASDCPMSIGLLAHRAGGAGPLTADDDGLLDDAARLAACISEGPYDSHALRVRHRCRVHRLWTP